MLGLVRNNAVRLSLHQPFLVDEALNFDKCARWPNIRKELTVCFGGIFPSAYVHQHNYVANSTRPRKADRFFPWVILMIRFACS